jgi:hypothetical protein
MFMLRIAVIVSRGNHTAAVGFLPGSRGIDV